MGEPFTVAKLVALIEAMPRRQTIAVCSIAPLDRAWAFKLPNEDITIMHPSVWREAGRALPRVVSALDAYAAGPVNLDSDTQEAKRIRDAFAEKLGQIPFPSPLPERDKP